MSHHHFDRHSCGCQSNHKSCVCKNRHFDQPDSCSCNSCHQRRNVHHDTCVFQRENQFPRNRFNRHNDRCEFKRRDSHFSSRSLSRLTPLRHRGHGKDCLCHTCQPSHSLGSLHSNHESLRFCRDDDLKKNIVIIL